MLCLQVCEEGGEGEGSEDVSAGRPEKWGEEVSRNLLGGMREAELLVICEDARILTICFG